LVKLGSPYRAASRQSAERSSDTLCCDEEAVKADEARRAMNADVPAFAGMTWLCEHTLPEEEFELERSIHPSFLVSAVDWHEIFGLVLLV
jgi:hypothetical protein